MLVAKGDSAALVCQATGIPSPTITWYKDGNEVRSIKQYCLFGLVNYLLNS